MNELNEALFARAFSRAKSPLAGRRKLYLTGGTSEAEHVADRIGNGSQVDDSTRSCWLWFRSKNVRGYASMTIDGATHNVSRISFEVFYGVKPESNDVCHRCDNPLCVNPKHLFLGSRSDNMRDCHAKGRSRIPIPRLGGEQNGAAKVTAADVLKIREMRANGAQQKDIAAIFGITDSAVACIEKRKTWRHIR